MLQAVSRHEIHVWRDVKKRNDKIEVMFLNKDIFGYGQRQRKLRVLVSAPFEFFSTTPRCVIQHNIYTPKILLYSIYIYH